MLQWKYNVDVKRSFVEIEDKDNNNKKKKIPIIYRTLYIKCVCGDPPGPKNYKISINNRYRKDGIIKYNVTKHIMIPQPWWIGPTLESDEWEKIEHYSFIKLFEWLTKLFNSKQIATEAITELETKSYE